MLIDKNKLNDDDVKETDDKKTKYRELDFSGFSLLLTYKHVANYVSNRMDKFILYELNVNNGLVEDDKPKIYVNMICHIKNLRPYFTSNLSDSGFISKLREIETTGICVYTHKNVAFTINVIGNKNDTSLELINSEKYNRAIITMNTRYDPTAYRAEDVKHTGLFKYGCVYINLI